MTWQLQLVDVQMHQKKNDYLGSVRTVKTTQEKHTSFMYAFPESKVPTDSYHGSGMGPGISSRA